MTDCPPQEQLERLFAGELPPAEESRLWRHVDECPTCADKEPEPEDKFGDLVAHLKGLDISGVDFDAAADHDLDVHAVRRHRPRTDDAAVTDQIPGYEILSELHRGGQGVVYEAIQQSTHRKVAIKVLLAGRYATPEAQRRFEREIELVAGLKHPGIVAVYDSGRTRDGRQYCVMDLVDGQPLDKWLADRHPEPREALDLFARICDAVHYAHQRGVIHRDIKPSNIVVENDGSPSVLDFGLARPAGMTELLVSTTGQILGTLPYMSPEQTRGSPDDIDIRTDVYSLGIVLYEMLTGQYPYPVDGQLPDVLRHIAESSPHPPSRVWTPASGIFTRSDAERPRRNTACPVDEDLDTIVFKALAKEKDRRYQTALDLARDIRHYLAGEPIEARRDSTWYVIRKTMKRHRAAVVAAVAFVLLLAAWGAAITVGYSHERELNKTLNDESLRTAQQRDRALAAEARAKKRFGQIRSMAESFLFDFHDAIKDLPGSTEAREFVVTRALAYLDRLARESGDDASLMRDLIAGYVKVGDVQGGVGTANLGDTQGAISSYEQAEALAKKWAAGAPDDLDAIRAVADARSRIGDLHLAQGDTEGALRDYQTSRDQTKKLLNSHPDNATYRRDLANVLSHIGNVYAAVWQFDKANENYLRAQNIMEELIGSPDEVPTDQHGLSVILLKRARAAINIERPEAEWVPLIDRSIAIARKAVDADPNSVNNLRDLGIALDFKAESLLESKDAEGALAQFRENLTISRRLLDLDPKNALAKHDMMISYNNVARAELALQENAKALKAFEKGLALAQERYREDPANYDALRDVARGQHNLADPKYNMGDAKGALETLNTAVKTYDEVADHDPNNFAVLRDICNVLGFRAAIYDDTANDESQETSKRVAAYRESAANFTRFYQILEKLKENGRLQPSEIPIIDQLKAEAVKRTQAADELAP